YAATWDSERRSGVQKSVDGGVTWTATGLQVVRIGTLEIAPWFFDVAVHPAAPASVYAGGFIPGPSTPVLAVSENGGATFEGRTTGLSGSGWSIGPVTSFALPPGMPGTAYTGASKGESAPSSPGSNGRVWKTQNSGQVWGPTNVAQPNFGILALVLDPV